MNSNFKLVFRVNKEKDMWNWWNGCNSTFMGRDWKTKVSEDVWKHLYKKRWKEARVFLKDFLDKKYKNNEQLDKFKTEVPLVWEKHKENILHALSEVIMQRPIVPDRVNCYFTTFPRGPYDGRRYSWMMVYFSRTKTGGVEFTSEDCIGGVIHELMHFQFHKYYWKFCEGLGLTQKQISHIKEACTVILNKYFEQDLGRDNGYAIHKEFRKELLEVWNETLNFEKFLIRAAELIRTKNF